MKTAQDVRDGLLTFLERDLVGPAGGPTESLTDEPPRIRYMAGVLFPQDTLANESSTSGGIEGDDFPDTDSDASDESVPDSLPSIELGRATSPESDHDDTVTLANTYRPSAIALSFMVERGTRSITVLARAARYRSRSEHDAVKKVSRTVWDRNPLKLPAVKLNLGTLSTRPPKDQTLTDGLCVRPIVRRKPNGRYLLTVSLYNSTHENSKEAETFYQVGFEVTAPDGDAPFVEYRTLEGLPEDTEEVALAMLYRRRRVFAVGHGCAANWASTDTDRTTIVQTAVLPRVIVPPVDPISADRPFLDMQFLRGDCERPQQAIPAALSELCMEYENWIQRQEQDARSLELRFRQAADRHLLLCRQALGRMREGVALLDQDPVSLDAFMIMNRVMLMQQHHAKLRRNLEDPWIPLPDAGSYSSNWSERQGFWRTFQIAFILMTLPSLAHDEATVPIGEDDSCPARGLVDLIWFPTGGGKTEAYLGLTAFTIFRGRLEGCVDPAGCKILMRYTLRLLTSQQFQRAASLICACELVRRTDQQRYGSQPIRIGLWVGMSLTPNDETAALQAVAHLERKGREAKNPFQLLSCPWCGTALDNPTRYGYTERNGQMIFQCPARRTASSHGCPFSERNSHLPVCVVDESIYRQPPTLVIGTVDKFAMLAWRPQAYTLLTHSGGPELIIQDELHLISGPLGSMVGLYEGVVDYLASMNGRRPKVIASTATIRRAREQCCALYDRPMFQFPPPGLDASDSFFAKEDTKAPGRLYVGFLPTAASSPLTAQIRSVVALQQGALLEGHDIESDEALDPYWTLVQYFGSLKELGRAATFVTADIPEFLPTMHRRFSLEGDQRRWMRTSEELTSRKNEDEIPKLLKRLEMKYRRDAEWDSQALDTVLATNMISVGVDIDRLGLMMIVTQPKGTSEYIQASSRVGRSRKGPGLIFTLYNSGRPRDRSHYEHFRSYHEAFYQYVEPTSVTPFAPPALERALHAVLVIAGRHIAKWNTPADIDLTDAAFADFVSFLRERLRRIDPDHHQEFEDVLRERTDEWQSSSPEIWGSLGRSEGRILMRPAGNTRADDDTDVWEVPTSLRNVDVECGANVIPRYIVSQGH